MAMSATGRRRRSFRILRLFFGLVAGYFFLWLRARLVGRSYDFFEDEARRPPGRAVEIRTTALQMGGVLVKVGQFLSTRVDLLPPDHLEELSLLQDEVPGVTFEEIRMAAETSLGGPLSRLFSSSNRFQSRPPFAGTGAPGQAANRGDRGRQGADGLT